MYLVKILFFLIINNIYSNKKYYNCRNEKSNKFNNEKNNSENENNKKDNIKNIENIKNVEFKQFNKNFKFTFLKNTFFQHNNNCTLNAIYSSLFNFPQIQNLLIYNNFNDKLLILSKKLLEKAINENNKNEAINYLDIYNNIFEYLKKNITDGIGGGNLSNTIKTDKFLGIFNNLGIIYVKVITSFIDYKLTKTCLENKENIINLNKNNTNIVNFKESLKNINLVKFIFKELKYYDKICKLIDNLNFNSENYYLFEPDDQAFIYNIDKNISLNCKYFIIIPENEIIKDYISKLSHKDMY